MAIKISATMIMGTLIRNTMPQSKCSKIKPPTNGPMAAPPPPTVPQIPRAKLRCFSSKNVCRKPDKVAGISIAAPKANKAREAISISALLEKAAHKEATAKIAAPINISRLKPIRSPKAPIGSIRPAITKE